MTAVVTSKSRGKLFLHPEPSNTSYSRADVPQRKPCGENWCDCRTPASGFFHMRPNWSLPFRGVTRSLQCDMMPSLRSFVTLLTVLAFSVASTGWGIASGLMASSGGKGHHAPIEASHSSGSHEHGDSDLAQNSACLEADGPACAAKHQHSDTSSSCCAMACHTAIPASACAMVVIAFERTIDHPSLEAGVKGSSATRLERPPRSADV